MKTFYPGTRVKVFDPSLFKMKEGTVKKWYGQLKNIIIPVDLELGPYDEMIDVEFDYRPGKISHEHFTTFVEIL